MTCIVNPQRVISLKTDLKRLKLIAKMFRRQMELTLQEPEKSQLEWEKSTDTSTEIMNSLTMAKIAFSLKKFLFTYLRGRVTDLPTTESFFKWLKMARAGPRPKAEGKNSVQISPYKQKEFNYFIYHLCLPISASLESQSWFFSLHLQALHSPSNCGYLGIEPADGSSLSLQ